MASPDPSKTRDTASSPQPECKDMPQPINDASSVGYIGVVKLFYIYTNIIDTT
ncbi:MAG: hypothetical protein KTR25_10300 [Myxococcales bacterium]|nr:hypothetical protein [Myxococcales bacterium]